MTMSRRPLNGTGLGLPVAIPVGGGGVLLHTLDGTTPALGGPFPQLISLTISNPSAAPVNVALSIGGVVITRVLAAYETVEILSQQPMLPGGVTPLNQIYAVADVLGAFAWGWFGTQS